MPALNKLRDHFAVPRTVEHAPRHIDVHRISNSELVSRDGVVDGRDKVTFLLSGSYEVGSLIELQGSRKQYRITAVDGSKVQAHALT